MSAPHVAIVQTVPGFESITDAGIVTLRIIVPAREMVSRPFCWLLDGHNLVDVAERYGTFGCQHRQYLDAQMREMGLESVRTTYRLAHTVEQEVFAAVNRMRQAMTAYSRVQA